MFFVVPPARSQDKNGVIETICPVGGRPHQADATIKEKISNP